MKDGIKALVDLFENGNVLVSGEKGSGKDVLFGNVIARIKRPYISNMNYTNDDRYNSLDLNKLDCGKNTYKNFVSGDIKYYKYPYDDGIHIYISDIGNYFPSQYTGILDRDYPYAPVTFSLIRQLGDCQIHGNTQDYNRVWNKLREQASERFIRCSKCYVLFGNQGKFAKRFKKLFKRDWTFPGVVVASYFFYDKASSCADRVKPCRVQLPLFANRDQRLQVNMYKDKFYNTYGTVEKHFYICINKSKHNSRLFKEILENGKKQNEKK